MTGITRRGLLFVFLLAMTAPARAEAPKSVPGANTLDGAGVLAQLERAPATVLIDARHEKDYKDGHIEGAVRLLDDDMIAGGEPALAKAVPNKATPIIFYCNGPACGRAAHAAQAAIGWGYSQVSYYYLGFPDWRAQGLPIVK